MYQLFGPEEGGGASCAFETVRFFRSWWLGRFGLWNDTVRWQIDPVEDEPEQITLLAGLDNNNRSFLDFWVLPSIDRPEDSTFVRRTLGCFEGHISMIWQDYLLVWRWSAQPGIPDSLF